MTDPVAAIKKLYFTTTRATISHDFDRAIDLLKSIADEDERARAAVFMDGLAQMRAEWGQNERKTKNEKRRTKN